MDNTQAWLGWAQQPFDQGGLGLEPHQAAGIVGNLVRESGRGLPAWGPTGDNGTAWGTAQWRGDRLTGLKQYAAQNGLDYRDPQAQMGFMRQELTTTHAGAYDALRAARTPEEAATAFNRKYEISADNTGGREASARALMDGGDPLAAINSAAGIRPQGTSALGFSGEGGGGDGPAGGMTSLVPGTQKDSRFSLGDIFGASDETKARMHGIGARLVRAAAALSSGVNPHQSAQLNTLGQSLDAENSPDYQYSMGANGQLVRINKRSGAIDSIAIPGSQKEGRWEAIGKDDYGNPTHLLNASTGEYKRFGGDNAPVAQIGGDPNLTGQERYDSLTSDEKKQMDAWRAGTGIQPSQYAMRNPATKRLVDAANAIGIDMNRYGERQAFFKGMASKSATTTGGQFVMAPTVLDHLSNTADDYLGLNNSSGGGYSTAASIANAYKDMRGGVPREAQQTSADRNSDTASKEIVSFLTRGHGGVTERQETHNKLYLPRAAPEVQAAALEAYRKQVADRFYELLDGSKGSVGENTPELKKIEEAFKAKDAALQEKIVKLRSGKGGVATSAPTATSQYQEGMTATGPNGQKIKFTNGKWVPQQ